MIRCHLWSQLYNGSFFTYKSNYNPGQFLPIYYMNTAIFFYFELRYNGVQCLLLYACVIEKIVDIKKASRGLYVVKSTNPEPKVITNHQLR